VAKNHAVLPRANRYVDVAIIGAGFSGSMVAVHLANTLRCAREIALIEKQRRTGPGIAYGTDNPVHLLNVPAGKMSAYPDKPSHFLEWLREHPELVRQYRLEPLTEQTFVPRSLFGLYLELLVQRSAIRSGHVHRFEREAVDLVKASDGSFHVLLADHTTIFARKAVLALGNFPPGDPVVADRRFHRSNNYLTDPWSSATLEKLSQTGDILILGSGLTALDLILSLNEMKQNGTIYVLSRHGHFPHRHAQTESYTLEQADLQEMHSVRGLLRAVRNEVSLAARANIGWRSVVDALRPHAQVIWQRLDLAERRRFFRHLRPYWEIHRHRAAPEALDAKDAMEKAGRLRCYQGRVERIVERENTLFVKFWNRSRIGSELAVSLVINCTGPECNYHKLKDPLVLQLFLRGLARPDPLFLGFDVNDQGQLIDVTGHAVPNLYTLGSTQKGRLLETTAVPELGRQAVELATLLADELQKATRLALEELPVGHSFEI
jgi:uncharacterized NAD(P)/FAD-binding protein YdhS